MLDENKSKTQLIAELNELRQRIADINDLEAERQQAEDALSKSGQRFRTLVDTCPMGIRQDTVDKQTAYANPAMCRMLELDTQDQLPGDWSKFVTPESHARIKLEYLKRLKGLSSSYDIEVLGQRGSRRNVIVHGAPLMSATGQFSGTIATFMDITERKQAEDALRRSQAMLQSIFRSAPVGIGVVSNRILQWTNDRLTQMTGYPATELIGQSSRIFYQNQEDYDLVGKEKYDQIRVSGSGTIETRWLCKDGRIIDVMLSSTAIDPENLTTGVVFTALDITERRQAEEEHQALQRQLQQSQKMDSIGQLAGGVAHDFNNLLSIILGYSEMILRSDPNRTEQRVRDRVKEIQRAGERARSLTRQLLAFGRKQILEVTPINLSEIVLGFEEMLRRLIGEDVAIMIRIGPDVHTTKADASQLDQVLLNVCINARDAMPDGGTLTIEVSNVVLDEEYAKAHTEVIPGSYVMMAVSDTGCGMDETTRQHVFEPFYTTKAKGKGSGLGMATVYGIIKQHGGHVSIYSELEQGTTVRIYLPDAPDQAVSVSPVIAETLYTRGTGIILVVEDDEAMRTLACGILSAYGYTILNTGSPAEAITIAAENVGVIDLLLTDVVMPEMNGRQLYEKAAAVSPTLRVLYMSGYTENAIAHHGVLENGVNFIQKPFAVSELLHRVKTVLTQE